MDSTVKSIKEQLLHWQTTQPEWFTNEEVQASLNNNTQNSRYSWPIKLLAMLGASVAALMFLIMLALADLIDSPGVCLGIGTLLLVGSLVYSRQISQEQIFLEPFNLVMGWVGQGLVAFGLAELQRGELTNVLLIFVVIESIILVVSNSNIQRFVALMAIEGCLLGIGFEKKWPPSNYLLTAANVLAITLLWANETTFISKSKRFASYFNVANWAFAISLCLLVSVPASIVTEIPDKHLQWIGFITIAVAIIYQLYEVYVRLATNISIMVLIILAFVSAILVFFSHGIGIALLLLLTGFRVGYYPIASLGVVALLYFTGMFYYDLHITLLFKSLIMISVGAIFLGTYAYLLRRN